MTLQPIASTTMASAIGVLAARAAGAIARGMNARRHDSTNQRPVMSSQAPLLLFAAAGVQPHSIYSYHPTVTTAATMLRRTKVAGCSQESRTLEVHSSHTGCSSSAA